MICPSRAVEIHHASQELPEQCPICGEENADPKTGHWVCEEVAPFCSPGCQMQYVAEQKKVDDSYAETVSSAASESEHVPRYRLL